MEKIIDSGKITPDQFCYWLQGVFEVAGPAALNEDQVKIIREHLALVFDKKTPDHSASPERKVGLKRRRPTDQTGAFIIGKTGTGKTTIAREMVGENLRAGKTVIILDYGKSYDDFVQVFDDKTTPLFVFDFGDVPSGETAEIPPFFRGSIGENIFVLVDESERVSEKFPELKNLMHQWVARGASFCIVGQDELCLQAFAGLPISDPLVTYCPAQQIRTPDGWKEWNYQILQPTLQPGGLVC